MGSVQHWSPRATFVVVAASAATFALPSPATAANSIFWGTETEPTIAFANLDGSGGANIATPGATVNEVFGTAIDSRTGKVYWAGFGGTISSANLNGSSAGNLSITGTTVSEPLGIAIDPEAGKLYWANSGNDTIAYANLDGSGGGTINTTGATVENPAGVAVDPAEGKVYWANFKPGAGSIAYANLNGTGGGMVSTLGAPPEGPEGVAVDPVGKRIYWGNYSAAPATIGFANLDNTGGGTLVTTGATVESPAGIAIDPVAGRLYWANSTGPVGGISYANLNDSGGGGNLATGSATADDPAFPSLLEAPTGEGAPAISSGVQTLVASPGGSPQAGVGAPLICSQGSWGPDVVSEFYFRAPEGFTYSWQLNGGEVAGATGPTFTPTLPGSYTCRVSATNYAGSTTQTSAPVPVRAISVPPSPSAPVITNARESASRWREGKKLAEISGKRHKKLPLGTTFSFTLNEAAAVTLSFKQSFLGRSVGHKCAAKTRQNAKRKSCKRLLARGGLSFEGHSGANKVVFQGRMSRSQRLKPGRYMLVITATVGGLSTSTAFRFTIVK